MTSHFFYDVTCNATEYCYIRLVLCMHGNQCRGLLLMPRLIRHPDRGPNRDLLPCGSVEKPQVSVYFSL